jgi:hypothetical protein
MRSPLVVVVVVVALLLAGCSVLPRIGDAPSTITPTPAPPASRTPSAAASDPTAPDAPGVPIAADGSVDVCSALPLKTVIQITRQPYRLVRSGDLDTVPDYVTSSCIYAGADPAKQSLTVLVSIGNAALAFQDAAQHGGVTPTDGVGDQAETDGLNQLTARFGDRECVTLVDASEDGDVGVRNLGALAVLLHEATGD